MTSDHSARPTEIASLPSTRTLALSAIPSAVIGVIAALVLVGIDWVAERLDEVLWTGLPEALGVPEHTWWWTILVLTVIGVAVGAVITWFPGHAGRDPGTVGMVSAPLPVSAVPGIAVALTLCLAGGVSLGPENPIIAINCALAVWVLTAAGTGIPAQGAAVMATAGTIGALFGTPVAAAILFTQMLAGGTGHLFDKLFAPLVAAGTGSLTMILIGAPQLSVDLPAYTDPAYSDILVAFVVALLAAALCWLATLVFPWIHTFFHSMKYPMVALGIGGLALGVLGAIGGPLTMFKGLHEMSELASSYSEYTALAILGMVLVKIAALTISAAAGFRGGKIFPAVFIGVAFGLSVAVLLPGVAPVVLVASGVLGAVMVVARDGWIALFLAAAIVGDVAVLPLMCVAVLPLWLFSRKLPEMELHERASDPEFGIFAPTAVK